MKPPEISTVSMGILVIKDASEVAEGSVCADTSCGILGGNNLGRGVGTNTATRSNDPRTRT